MLFINQNSIVEKYGDSVVVLGFPCNQFGHQSNEGDTEFLNSLKYVRPGNGFVPSFHVFGKIQVNGANSHPLFRWMRQQIPIPMDPPGDSKGNGVDDWDVLVLPRSGFDSTTIAPWSPITRSDVAWYYSL